MLISPSQEFLPPNPLKGEALRAVCDKGKVPFRGFRGQTKLSQANACTSPKNIEYRILNIECKSKLNTSRIIIRNFLFLFLAIFIKCSSLQAQDNKLVFDHINLPEFKDNSVFCMVQDNDGFLWFGTNNGLYKFDGYKAIHYEYDPLDKNSILTGAVRSLFFDKKGALWVGTRGSGICKMDIKKGSFQRFTYNPVHPDRSIASNSVRAIGEDKDSNIWIGTEDSGVTRFTPRTNSFTTFNRRNSVLASNMVLNVFIDRKKNFHIGCHTGGLYMYDAVNKKIIEDPHSEMFKLSKEQMYSFEDTHDHIWIATPHDILKFEAHSGKLIKRYAVATGNEKIGVGGTYIYEDRDGIVWITSTDGTGMYKISGETLVHLSNMRIGPHNLSSNLVYSVFEDKAGNIWIGTGRGVDKIGYLQKIGLIANYAMPDERYASQFSIRSVYKDKDNIIWAGSSGGGLLKITQDGKIKLFKFLPDTNLYGYNYINYIYEQDGHLWICCPRGLFDFDKGKGKFTRSFFSEDNPVRKIKKRYSSVWSVCEAYDEQHLWVGTRDSGLYLLNTNNGSVQKYINDPKNSASLQSNTIWGIYKYAKDKLWLCTDDGLSTIEMNGTTPQFKNYVSDETKENRLHGHHIWDILEDRKGYFWIASTDGGLARFDKNTGIFKNFTTRDNLPTNTIAGILEDDNDRLWISTINGICVFDEIQEKGLATYNLTNGLQGNCFNFKSCCEGLNSHMLFGSTEGITEIDASKIVQSKFDPSLTITLFDVLYKYNMTDITDGNSIALPYDENSFSIEFASLDFTNPEKNNFAYRMEGLDTSWTYSKTRHYVSYTHLSPGHYIFHLKGTNSEGHWSNKTFTYSIYIIPPFWMRWWFILLVILAFAFVVYLSVIGSVRRRKQKRIALLAQLTSLRAQLNPHFIFNALNSIQHFINSNEKMIANSFLSKFASLIRSTLENSSKETVTIREELDFLKLYTDLESLRLDGKAEFKFDIDSSIDISSMRVPPMLIQPLIENSIIHGLVALQKNGKIEVLFRMESKILHITVRDNGIGRAKATELNESKHIKHTSSGTKLIWERLNLIGLSMRKECKLIYSDILNDKGEICGTCAELILPL